MKLSVSKQRWIWWLFSVSFLVAGAIAMGVSWTNLGAPLRPSLDFVGGTRLQLELDCQVSGNCDRPVSLEDARAVLAEEGLANSSLQAVGEDRQGLSIRTTNLDVERRSRLTEKLSDRIGSFDPAKTKIDTVGPVVGRQLFTSGLVSLAVAFIGIVVYLSARFQLDYAIFAIVALFHDAWITLGVFATLGLVAGTEVDTLFLVALLTIVGFSVNDTVVIYDRVREKIKQNPDSDIDEQIDLAVNETLTRSINTTLTTLLSLVAIFLFGGDTLKNFALALIVGFLAGAYSSIFIASSLLGWWRKRQPSPTPRPPAPEPQEES